MGRLQTEGAATQKSALEPKDGFCELLRQNARSVFLHSKVKQFHQKR
jgi:hypothetical protein